MSTTEDLRTKVERVLAELDAQRGVERGRIFEEEHKKKHYHKCPDKSCGHIWSHRMSDFNSAQEHIEGHLCPVCKREQSWKCRRDGTPL